MAVKFCSRDWPHVNPSAPFTPTTRPATAPFYAERIDADTWPFTGSTSSPERVTAKAQSSAGAVIAEKEADLDWKRWAAPPNAEVPRKLRRFCSWCPKNG